MKHTLTITAFRPLCRGTLRGFAAVHIRELRLTIHDVAVHRHAAGAHWVQLPSKPLLNPDGTPKRTNGRIEYARILGFDSAAVAAAFGDAAIEALLEFNPTIFDESAVA